MNDTIQIKGARENNLKNVDLTIPRDKLVVFTGLSGSGKASLAFDTIYAEGQRRYVESLSSYARQFLGQMDKPDVDSIDGLSPAISIDQKTTSKNPRSTVGTVTEIYDYLRLLWARVGIPHCPKCGKEISRQTIDQIVDRIEALGEGTRFIVLSPVIRLLPLTNEEMLILIEKLADIHAGLYEYKQIVTQQDMVDFIEIEFSRIGADTHITPREVIRDFIEVLDIIYQNPGMKVRTLLGSESFTYAQNAVNEETTHAEFAEFDL